MLRDLLRGWIPAPNKLQRYRSVRLFGRWVEESHLWQLSRQTAAKAFAIGLYCAMLPMPGQVFVAIGLAILWRANLPLSFALLFLTNPLTMPPIYYGAYKLGVSLLGSEPMAVEFEASWTWFTRNLDDIWLPLALGSQILGILAAASGYLLVDGLWRNAIKRRWKTRQKRRRQ